MGRDNPLRPVKRLGCRSKGEVGHAVWTTAIEAGPNSWVNESFSVAKTKPLKGQRHIVLFKGLRVTWDKAKL